MKYKNCFSFLMILIVTLNIFAVLKVGATPIIGSTKTTLYPIADAYVNETSPEANYGLEKKLRIKFNSHLCYAYIMFDLSAVPAEAALFSATLMVYAYSGSWKGPFGSVSVGAHYSSDNTWTEEGITWNNKPAFKDEATDKHSFGMFAYEGYRSWNVTEDLKIAFSGGRLTEVLKFDSGEYGGISFRSREASSKPMLIVEYTTEPIYNLHIESIQDTGDTSNLGHIIIDENLFTLPNDVSAVTGSYQTSYESGYKFVKWEVTGGVSVSDPNSKNTTVTVSGDGTLRAVGNAEKVEYAYDDGSSETSISKKTGCMIAVKFTPLFHGELENASFYVVYVSSNASKNIVKVHVMDENRRDLITPFLETFDSKGWFNIDMSAYSIEVSSEFYVGVEWTTDYDPDLGGDSSSPNDRNWYWDGTEWREKYDSKAYMIRVKVKSSVPITVLQTPTPSPSPTPTSTATPTPTASPTPTVSPSPTPIQTPTPTIIPSPTATPTPTLQPSPTPSISTTPTPTASPTPIPTPTPPSPGVITFLETYGLPLLVLILFVAAITVGFIFGRRSRRKAKTFHSERKIAVPGKVQAAKPFMNAMFVFNSDEISDKVSSVYGAYAQGELLKAMSRGLEPFGGWESCPSVMLCCDGDLFERSVMGETPSLTVLSNWIKSGLYGIDINYLDPDMVEKVKANKSLEYIPYVVGIGPIEKSHALLVHSELKAKGVTGYLGLFTLTGVDIPRLDSLLYLPQNMKIMGKKCIGGMVNRDDLHEAGLERK